MSIHAPTNTASSPSAPPRQHQQVLQAEPSNVVVALADEERRGPGDLTIGEDGDASKGRSPSSPARNSEGPRSERSLATTTTTESSSDDSSFRTHLETHHAGLSNAGILKSVVYGGIDGVITTFSIISSCYGANLAYGVIIALGVANVLADGFSMGFGDFISGKMEKTFVEAEREKEIREFHRKPKHEKKEIKDLLVKAEGMTPEDAHIVVEVMAKYEDFFIRNMMIYELDLAPDTESWNQLVWNGVATFASFIMFGIVPLLAYFVGLAWERHDRDENAVYGASCALAGVTLFSVGAFSAKLTKQPGLMKAGVFTLFNGTVAGTLSFLVGYLAEKAFND